MIKNLFPWAGDANSVDDPDLELARERVEAYRFGESFNEKIRARREFYENCLKEPEKADESYHHLVTIAASVPAAHHMAAYGEGALAESFLWFIKKDEGLEAVTEVLRLFNWDVEVYDEDNELLAVHWTDILTVWGKEIELGEDLRLPSNNCPVCGVELDVGTNRCWFCGEEVEVIFNKLIAGFRFLARSFREHVVRIVVEDCGKVLEEHEPCYREECYELFPKLKNRKEKIRKSARGRFPPCIKLLLERAQDGENLSHEERFHLCAFLTNVANWPVDKVVEVFSNLPDFDEERTRYQVRHIAGLEGSGTKYLPYSCEKAKLKGVCPGEDCGVRHPSQYYFSRSKNTYAQKSGGSDG